MRSFEEPEQSLSSAGRRKIIQEKERLSRRNKICLRARELGCESNRNYVVISDWCHRNSAVISNQCRRNSVAISDWCHRNSATISNHCHRNSAVISDWCCRNSAVISRQCHRNS
ncbi:hypothetical protein P5673_025574 [Acropora cervicornis]|uniref:Uncharacterized protein n=1 Tax=Acropora cervicornis TaxID=6130 RepID=A0AAD9Q1U3_ACRCE|nr:hypothetical protein P5673_025574 [Acropora cervicornis]